MRENRRVIMWAGSLYLLFVIYGSLVPLDFHPQRFDDAWKAFRHIRYLQLGVGDRADWVANILLFIPLSFLWLGMFIREQGRVRQAFLGLGVFAACAALSIAIEFVQIFFPPRTVSLNDIAAETIGAAVGVIGWFLVGWRFQAWLSWRREIAGKGRVRGTADHVLKIYLCMLFFYNLMPFDLTLSPVEMYHKWRAGRVIVVPFSYHFADSVQMIYGLGTDILIWIPMPVLLILVGKPAFRSWLVTVGCSALIECLQLFVYTRVSDVTQIMMAAVGAAAGVWIGRSALIKGGKAEVAMQSERPAAYFAPGAFFAWVAVSVVWIVVLALVFWYPFNFHLERRFILERVHRLAHSVPFQGYYFGSEYRALTEVFHKTLFFAPLGITLAMASLAVHAKAWRVVARFVALAIIGAVAFGIDLGRVLLPDRYPDLADWFLQVFGALVGYWGVYRFKTESATSQGEAAS